MLLPADCAAQEISPSPKTRMSEKLKEIHVGNFSHSEKAELRPEFMAFNMGPLGNGGYMLLLDALGCAAAGRKLTLDRGLRKENSLQKKGQGLLPAQSN